VLARFPILAALRGVAALRLAVWLAFGLAVTLLSSACSSMAAAQTAPTPAPPASSTSSNTQVFTVYMIDANKFVPATLVVPRGATVTWQNVSTNGTEHTSTDNPTLAVNPADAVLPDGAQPWHQGDIGPGQSFSLTFTVPGTYSYFCRYHEGEGMLGTITVLN
jgi:plastocyanin